MPKYCLTYDFQGVEAKDYEDAKVELLRLLIQNGAKNLTSPCASTILFYDISNLPINKWEKALFEFGGAEMFYYLCIVATEKQSYLEKENENINLRNAFRQLIDTVQLPLKS